MSTTEPEERVPLSARVPRELHERLRREAEFTDRSASAIVRIALAEHFAHVRNVEQLDEAA